MSCHIHRYLLAPLAVLSLITSPGWSVPVPRTIGFTGMLADPAGKPLADGTYNVQLAIYNSENPGMTAQQWHEEKAVRVTRGLFSTALGDATALPDTLDFSQALFVGIRVGDDPEMQPRLALQGVPYALFAHSVPNSSIGSGQLAYDPASLGKLTGSRLTLAGGNLGIGNANPAFTLATSSQGTIATGALRLQNTYLESGIFGIELAGVDNGQNGHDLRVRGRTSPTGAFSDILTVRNDGSVGIKTLPVNALSVNGTANIEGNLGIGTSAPSARLDVLGEIRFGLMSQYTPVAGDTPMRIVTGHYWTANGGYVGDRSGFTVNRNGVGDYTVSFKTPFSSLPAVSILPSGNHLYGIFLVRLDLSTLRFQTYSNGSLTEVDSFSVLAAGPRSN